MKRPLPLCRSQSHGVIRSLLGYNATFRNVVCGVCPLKGGHGSSTCRLLSLPSTPYPPPLSVSSQSLLGSDKRVVPAMERAKVLTLVFGRGVGVLSVCGLTLPFPSPYSKYIHCLDPLFVFDSLISGDRND